jgi:NAD(P)-dependent dehydrogenase (short-subunit alcohol dehydrogenase family)
MVGTRRFENQRAVITGAAGGIGAAVAVRLAREGAAIAAIDLDLEGARRTAERIEGMSGRARAFEVNIRSPQSIENGIDAAERELGPISLVVNCAGIIKTFSFLDLPEENWDLTLDVNLKGTFFVIQTVARRMVEHGLGGHMVAISSVAGRRGRADSADYSASKAGVISVVRSAALALAPHGITVNAICPGIVETPMTYAIHQERAQRAGITPEESLAALATNIPLGRIEVPDDVANAAAFLLSDEAGYITGQALNVCGGLEFD